MQEAAAREFVEGRLRDYHELTRRTLLSSVPVREPRRYLYDLVPSYPTRPGKGLRPGLCIGTCRAFRGSVESVLRSAVTIEFFHNAFLVHDDLEDGSEFRRGQPTLHAEHGLGIAVNVGDAMSVLSIRPLMENLSVLGATLTWRVFEEIQHMVLQSVEGQAMELGWVRDNACRLTDDDYLRMTLKKTCWYTCIHPCRIGALIATGGSIDLDRFNRFGYFMGAAFQIQDDLLNLVGDWQLYGKEIGGDVWEGKRTLMLIHALNAATDAEHERMQRFLAAPRTARTVRDVRWVYKIMAKYESVEYGRDCARQLAAGALEEFELAYADAPPGDDRRFIEQIVHYMVERDL
jgi:geranylgeranyl diphosphate synthase, type II